MHGFYLSLIKKNIMLIRIICLLFVFFDFSNVHAKDIEQPYWILDEYVENYNQMNKNNYNFDYLNNLRVKLVNNIIYINDNQYNVSVRQTSDISQLLTKDLIEKTIINKFILPTGGINYLQFEDVLDSNLAKLLLPKGRLILGKEELLIINESLVASFLKPKDKNSFLTLANKFPALDLPINSRSSTDFIKDENYHNYPQNISKSYLHYLKLFDDNSLYEQLNNYLTNLNGIKLPKINNVINPILISGTQENEEEIVYLHLFSEQFNFLDKIILSSRIGMTRENPATGDLPIGFIYYNIDKNYFIERRQRFEDETIEVQHFQVTKEGKFQELPVTSNCYSELAVKDNKTHSTKSLLLTSQQANNYMRFESEKIDELDDITLTLNPADKKLCVNYQQTYSFTFGKAKSKQLFGNEKRYQQQVENFKEFNIDISDELEYIAFDNIDKSPLAKYLLNGNKAIYMNEMLFIVGEDYLAAYRQPTVIELTYQE